MALNIGDRVKTTVYLNNGIQEADAGTEATVEELDAREGRVRIRFDDESLNVHPSGLLPSLPIEVLEPIEQPVVA